MKEKWLSVVLAGAVTVSPAGCGGDITATVAAPATEARTEAAGSKTEEAQVEDGKTEAAAPETGADVVDKTVAFIPRPTGNAFFEPANNDAQEYSKGWDFTVDYQGSANVAVADQVNVINNAVASGVDATRISSVGAAGLDSTLTEAKEIGVTVVAWDSDVSDTARTLMVSQGTSDLLGKMLVDVGTDSLTNRGKDIKNDTIKYCWHYSQATVADQSSWQVADEAYIKENFPNWKSVASGNYCSEQDAEKTVSIGVFILEVHSDIGLIICNGSTALPGQCEAIQNKGLTKEDVTITGLASPMPIKDYCAAGVIEQWGLWDCGVQGAMGCYLAAYLAAGNEVYVGDKINIPDTGEVEVMPNDSLVEGVSTAEVSNGVVLLPERTVFSADNMNDYNF